MNILNLSHSLPAFLKLTLLVVLFAAIGAIALARRQIIPSQLMNSAPLSAATNEVATPRIAQDQRRTANIEAEIVTITPHGFEPDAITRPRGRFLLTIEDRSGFDSLSLRLVTATRLIQREVPMVRESPEWSEVIDPPTGTYFLVDPTHPLWLCRITITP
jgi:hypothetical protein